MPLQSGKGRIRASEVDQQAGGPTAGGGRQRPSGSISSSRVPSTDLAIARLGPPPGGPEHEGGGMNRNIRTARKLGGMLAGAGLASAMLAMALPATSAHAAAPFAAYSATVNPV